MNEKEKDVIRNGNVFTRAGEERIELPLTVLETVALPLYYSPIRFKTTEGNYTTRTHMNQEKVYESSDDAVTGISDIGDSYDLYALSR